MTTAATSSMRRRRADQPGQRQSDHQRDEFLANGLL
jgi:hypothetical protein